MKTKEENREKNIKELIDLLIKNRRVLNNALVVAIESALSVRNTVVGVHVMDLRNRLLDLLDEIDEGDKTDNPDKELDDLIEKYFTILKTFTKMEIASDKILSRRNDNNNGLKEWKNIYESIK